MTHPFLCFLCFLSIFWGVDAYCVKFTCTGPSDEIAFGLGILQAQGMSYLTAWVRIQDGG